MEQIKELRSLTGCGIVDCKEALAEADDNIDKAVNVLRKKGITKAVKKSDRCTGEGVVASYVHTNHKLAVLVTILCETDFVAKTDKFKTLANDIAMHIAAMDPVAVSPDDIPAEDVAAESALAREEAAASNKPVEIQAKMVAGKVAKFKAAKALLTQPFVKDPHQTVEDLIKQSISELGENITVKEFTRLAI